MFGAGKPKPLSRSQIAKRVCDAGKRALAEAEARHAQAAAQPGGPKEIGGQAGPEPTRYGDWEKKGLISDF
jgi:hypothetical protein